MAFFPDSQIYTNYTSTNWGSLELMKYNFIVINPFVLSNGFVTTNGWRDNLLEFDIYAIAYSKILFSTDYLEILEIR